MVGEWEGEGEVGGVSEWMGASSGLWLPSTPCEPGLWRRPHMLVLILV